VSIILAHFSLQISSEMKVIVTKTGRSVRPQPFIDYPVIEHFMCSVESSSVCAVAFIFHQL
jgi:hypothetical protein